MSIKSIGTAKLTDFTGWIDRIKAMSLEEVETAIDALEARFIKSAYPNAAECNYRNLFSYLPKEEQLYIRALKDALIPNGWCSYTPEETKEVKFLPLREQYIQRLETILEYVTDYGQTINVSYWSDEAAYLFMGNPDTGFTVLEPAKYMTFCPHKDWSALTPAEVRKALGHAEELPPLEHQVGLIPLEAQESMCVQQLADHKSQADQAIEQVNQDIEKISMEANEELAKMRQEIRQKEAELRERKESMMAELDKKLEEMTRQKDALEAQIFLLDSQIYDICCYAGETVQFMRVKAGRGAPADEPVVVYQKLRFLDEDLGRLTSIYEIQWGKISMFEDFLRSSPYALDVFAPNEKCVVLVRISRTGKLQRMENTRYYQTLENYSYYHGGTIGIILRNGENIYLGWTDDNRVHIKDDLILGRSVTLSVEPDKGLSESASQSERKRYYEMRKKETLTAMDGVVSRRFVYSILQGIIDNSTLLGLPKGTDIGKPGPLVIHSLADNALEDNRFGAFANLVKRCNHFATRGDMILTLTWLRAHSDRYNNNDRGIGYADRTHDVKCPDCAILPINLVRASDHRGNNEVYVSLKKGDRGWWPAEETNARANFRLYSSEYINLTYMNSVWLEYAINNKKLGVWCLNGEELSYAHAVRYLNTALQYIRTREMQEQKLLDAINPGICRDAAWPVKLSEWKMSSEDHPVRRLTEYQAKRFARSLGYNC